MIRRNSQKPNAGIAILVLSILVVAGIVWYNSRSTDSTTATNTATNSTKTPSTNQPANTNTDTAVTPQSEVFSWPTVANQTPTVTTSDNLQTWEYADGTITKNTGDQVAVDAPPAGHAATITVSGYPAIRSSIVSQKDGVTLHVLTITTPSATYTITGSRSFIDDAVQNFQLTQ